jgi:electron transfer flavoprotein alpha subunit
MEKILVLAHNEADGTLPKPALEAVSAGLSLRSQAERSELMLGLIGEIVQTGADQVAGCEANRIFAVVGPAFSQSRYATDTAAVEAICRASQATLVLVPATTRFSRCLAGVAQRLKGRVDTHATAIHCIQGVFSLNRWYYRQRMEAELKRTQRPWLVSLEPGCHEPWKGQAGATQIEIIEAALAESGCRTEVVGIQAPPADEQTIRPDAELLLVAGAGWTKNQPDGKTHVAEAQTLILDFLRFSKASLGGSKSLVDLSGEGQAVLPFMTHLNQVGQTGSTPRHPKGLSTCCHGEEPHAVGWRFINERRAINLDPNCGWARGKADVLYVGDAFKVMEKVNALLSQRKA